MALRIYRSPDGYTFQFEEGTQPAGYVLVTEKPKAAPKRRTTANKAAQPKNK